MCELIIKSETSMLKLAGNIANQCPPGFIIYLSGELGAGKTTFARGFITALGHQGHVKSPTYTLIEGYELNQIPVFHFDLYRIADPQELEYIGLHDYFTADSIVLIEWPERGGKSLPAADLSCYIEHYANGRKITLSAQNAKAKILLNQLKL